MRFLTKFCEKFEKKSIFFQKVFSPPSTRPETATNVDNTRQHKQRGLTESAKNGK